MSDDLVKRWDEYVESMGSVMGEVEHIAQQMRDRIEQLAKHALRADAINEELEAKLKKAVASLETLEDASKFFGSDRQTDYETLKYAHETTRRLCKTTLAQLKGEGWG